MKKRQIDSQVVRSLKDAARLIGCTTRTLQNDRAAGCRGFNSDGTVDVAQVQAWQRANRKRRESNPDLKSKKTREEIRKLKLANDLKEGRLIERAWMAERVHAAAGQVDAYRMKSEAEHPLLFAAANGDVAKCREIIRQVWNEIAVALNGMKDAFKAK